MYKIQTKDCVDSNVFLMRLQQNLWIFPKRMRVWIGISEYIAVFTILQLLNDPVHVLIKSNKPAWDLSIHSIYLKIFFPLVDWNHSMNLMRGAFAVLKMNKCVRYCDYVFLRWCRSFQFKFKRMVILNLGQESIFRILLQEASST